jgi:ribonuclease BN (tRNA processing enzyme)
MGPPRSWTSPPPLVEAAFLSEHGEFRRLNPGPAFGYRFETSDRTIVLSGDTSPSQNIVDNCNGCDVLIHEVYTQTGYDKSPPASAAASFEVPHSNLFLANDLDIY